ncbi:hypothetical protein CI102_8557 [Trichoderma harzianum]|nr:hypothetical protein CI102_8557 [Trichoderma harzianum]
MLLVSLAGFIFPHSNSIGSHPKLRQHGWDDLHFFSYIFIHLHSIFNLTLSLEKVRALAPLPSQCSIGDLHSRFNLNRSHGMMYTYLGITTLLCLTFHRTCNMHCEAE